MMTQDNTGGDLRAEAMSEFDRRRDIEAEGQRALMVPIKPDLSNMGKSTAYKIGYRQGQADAPSAAMQLPEMQGLKCERDAAIAAYWRVRSYAVHDDDCTINRYPSRNACSCGLTAALAPFTAAKETP